MIKRRPVGTRQERRNQDLRYDIVNGTAVSGGGWLVGNSNISGKKKEEEDGIANGG